VGGTVDLGRRWTHKVQGAVPIIILISQKAKETGGGFILRTWCVCFDRVVRSDDPSIIIYHITCLFLVFRGLHTRDRQDDRVRHVSVTTREIDRVLVRDEGRTTSN
jgi:hypothetical protein